MLSAAGDDADGPLLEQSRSPSRSPGKGRVSLAPSAGDAVRAWNVVATGPAAPERDPDSSAREFSAIAGRSGSGGRALWRVDALAVLEADGDAEDSEQEAFSALSNAHAFAIVAGNEVHVLSEDCGEHRATITFELPITAASLSSSSPFAAIADASGTLHFAHLTSGSVVFSQELGGEVIWVGFAGGRSEQSESLLVVLSSTLLRFSSVSLTALDEAISNGDLAAAAEIKSGIAVERIDLENDVGGLSAVDDVACLGLGGRDERVFVAGHGDPSLLVFRKSPLMNKTMLLDSISLLPQPTPILRLAVDPSTPNPSTLLALTESGHVNILDARSLIILKVSRAFEGAYDLRIVSSNSAVLFTADTATVLALPSLEPIQSYPLLGKCYSAAVTLAPGESDARMQLCFLEQHDGALVVRRLAEVAPERRLAMLIRQHRWVEAEALAVEHEMDIVAVLRAKLMDRVSESLNDVQIDVAEVLRDLAGCDADPKFVVEVCLQLLPQNLPDAYSLLTFALDADPGCAEVHMQLKRLGTMQLVAARYDPNEWHAFRSVDLAVELANLVARGDLHRTVVVWRRHHLDANLASHADDILAGMPDEVKPASYLAWLRDEVLPLLSGSQRARAAVWIEKRARTVEARERKPHMALKIIKLLDIEQSSSATTSGQLHHDAGGPPTPAAYVVRTVASTQSGTWASNGDDFLGKVVADSLKAQLVDLVELWDKHDLRLSLADYANETPQSIAIELLDRVAAPEMLKMAVEEHFKPYAQKNDLSCDELLTEYAAEIMEGAGSSGLAGSPWEARVLALVGCMSSIETKIETLLEVMRRAPIPWSPELDAAVTEALSWTSVRRIDELQEQYRLMQLKKMLLKYDIASFNVSDLSLALGLMRHILSRTDMIDVMPDALQVVSAYHHLNKLDAFATRLRNLFMDGLNARAIAVLHTGDELVKESVCPPGGPSPKEHAISLADQLSICGETVEWALVTMEEAVAFQDVTEERGGATYRLALNAAIDICTAILRHHLQAEPTSIAGEATTAVVGKSTEWQKRLEEFNNLRSLYDNFGFMVSPAEYHEDLLAVQNRLLGEMAREVFRYASGKSSSDRDRTSGRRTQKDLYRLAELLGVPRDDLKGVMAEEAARCGDFRTVSLLCKEIIERGHDEKVGATLRGVAARLTAYAAQHSEVFRDSRDSLFSHRLTGDIKRLAQQAIVCCSADTVPDALDAFKTYELADSIFKQCDAGDYETLLAQIDEETEKEEMIFAGGASASASGSGSGSASSSSVPIASKSAKSSIGRSSASLALDHDVRNVEDAYGKALFLDHFYENGLVLETEGTMALAAQFAVSSLAPTVPTNGSAKSKSKTTESRGPVASGRELVDYLSRNQCRMLTLHVWQRILEHTIRKNPENAVAEFQVEELGQRGYFDLITSLLQTVLSTRYIDDTLALGFMLCLPLEKAFEAYKMGVQTTGTEYHRLVKIATIGCAAGAAWSQRSFQLDCQQLGTNARWWQQLRLLEIPFDEAAYRTSRGGEYQRGVVVPLLQKTSFDLLTVLEFSRTYNIEDDFVLLNYVKLLLQEDADSSYAWKIAAVIDDVVNREKLQKLLLEHCYPTISPYDYEKSQFVFTQVRRLDDKQPTAKKGLLLLEILSNYQRVKPASEEELVDAKRAVEDSQYDSGHGETVESLLRRFPLATKRLPLKHFMQSESHFWPMLQEELSEDSLPKLISLTIPLGISPDRFYETVIRSMARTMKLAQYQSGETSGETIAAPRLKFADFRPLLLKYREISDALQMTAYVAGVFPCGPDRIQGYKTGLHLADKWVQKLQSLDAKTEEDRVQLDKASTAQSKIRHLLAATETEFQLRNLNLAPFLEFLTKPVDLIIQLYTQKARDMVLQKDPMDLHAVVDDIGKRHGIDVEKLRLKLIHHWLSQEVPATKEDKDSFLPSIRIQMGLEGTSATERSVQLRLLYLLRSQPMEKSVREMLQLACQPSSKINNTTRIRALCVLFQLANPEEISKQMSFDQLRNYLQTLLYLTDFEELRIPQTIKEFSSCDKEALVRSLWLNHNAEPKALQLICNISIDFRLWDATLWENVLHRLLKQGSYPYLMSILEHVSAVPELSQVKFLSKLWDNVILGSLTSLAGRASSLDDSEKASRYLKVVQMIQKCPFLPQLSMQTIMDQFGILVSTAPTAASLVIALRALSALPQSAEAVKATNKVLETATGDMLRKSLELIDRAVADAGRDFDHYNDLMKAKIFDCIDARRIYDCLLRTPHLLQLVTYLINDQRAHNMILFVIKSGKHAEACDLACMHYAKLRGAVPEGEKEEILRQFLAESLDKFDRTDQDFINRIIL